MKKLGILGGGQLGLMICEAAEKYPIEISILDPSDLASAKDVCDHFIKGSFKDDDDVRHLASGCDILTIEIEHVATQALSEFAEAGKIVGPSANVIDIIKDKGLQKLFFQDHELPTSAFQLYHERQDIWRDILHGERTYPFVQKLRTGGYDGRSVVVINNEDDLENLMTGSCVIEEKVNIEKELAITVARSVSGQIAFTPICDMVFHAQNVLDCVLCPAGIDFELEQKIKTIARSLAEKLELVGILAIELFLDKAGNILINELAPRPHNSAHHTIESCHHSQYDLLLQALLDMPLMDSTLIKPAGMINLLSSAEGKFNLKTLEAAISDISETYIHWYNKAADRPHRKLGHVTCTAESLEEVQTKLNSVKKAIEKAQL